jgi:apolipoprotein N-acyltransferase
LVATFLFPLGRATVALEPADPLEWAPMHTDAGTSSGRHRQAYRLVLCGHKAVEAGTVCLLLMVQGDLLALTSAHLLIAAKTGALAVSPALLLTLPRQARHLVNRWTASCLLAVFTFFGDAWIHASHYPGAYTEAALTAVGAFFFSLAVSYTPLGKRIDRLAESFL